MAKRRDIRRLGEHGNRVILFKEGHLARVQWRRNGKLLTRSFPQSLYASEALAFARGVVTTVGAPTAAEPAARVSLRDLWDAYEVAEFDHLRERTQVLYRAAWQSWELMFGRLFAADDTTKLMMPQFVAALRKRGLAPNTIREQVSTIKRIYAWGEELDLVTRNRVHAFKLKIHRDERRKAPEEYRPDEWAKILAALDPERLVQWRPWVALTICGLQGARQSAVLSLRWSDVDFAKNRIAWRADSDKMGKEWSQPMRAGTLKALEIAARHREEGNGWVIPAGSSKNAGEHYTIQSLWSALRRAEDVAEVRHIPGRGGHGARRMVATDVMAKTKDPGLATAAINDSIAQAPRYIKKREEAVDAAILQLDEVAS